MVVAFLLPALVLFTAVLAPLEVGGPEVLSYARVHAFASSWWGAIFIMMVNVYHNLLV